MKKYLIESLSFAIAGLLSGVYYREFTRMKAFEGRTNLGMAHPHILVLGFFFFLIVAIFVKVLDMKETKKSKAANITYVSGLSLTSIMMIVRGTMEVAQVQIEKVPSMIIASAAGIGHIAVAVGIVLFVICFIKAEKASNKKEA